MRWRVTGTWLFLLASGCDCGTSITGPDGDADADADTDGDSDGDADADGDGDGDGDDCVVEPAPGAFENPGPELHWGDVPPEAFPDYLQVIHSPIVVQLLEDGPDDRIPEVIVVTYRRFREAGVLRVFSGRAPHTLLYTVAGVGAPDDPSDVPLLHFDGHPAAGDIDGDGRVEIVVGKMAGGLIAYRDDGSVLWESDEPPFSELRDNASIALADLEGDGDVEIVVGRVVLDHQGNVLWTGTGTRGMNSQGPLSCVADLDQDGNQEIIAGGTIYAADSAIAFRVDDDEDGFCAIADVFGDGGAPGRDGLPEIVRVTGGRIRVHDGATGARLANLAIPGGGAGGAPTIADFDGDGLAEIGAAGATRYVVWDVDTDTILWQAVTEDDSSNVTSSTVFDFNGDGIAEVVYNDEQYFRVYAGPDGTVLFEEPNPSRTRTEQPVVADVDGDGNAEIVFPANTEAAFAGDHIPGVERLPGFEIWGSLDDSWVPTRTIWNQHTYHVTNVDETGAIPAHETPSWIEHNTYRLNTQGELILRAPDLTPLQAPLDTDRCNEDPPVLGVCAEVRNRGAIVVGPGLDVTFYDGDPDAGGTALGTTETTRALLPGDSEVVCVDWTPAPLAATEVWVRVDATGEARECLEDNNTVSLGEVYCSGIQ
jgi:hypothetical protein